MGACPAVGKARTSSLSRKRRRRERAAARQTPPSAEQVRLQTERNSLELSRTRVLKDLEGVTHPRRREQLEAALRYLDRKLAELK